MERKCVVYVFRLMKHRMDETKRIRIIAYLQGMVEQLNGWVKQDVN